MAEPLAIIGAVAAVSQVTHDLVKLTTNLRRYVKVIHRAPEEVQAFVMETSNFTGILNFFTELAKDSSIKDIERKEQREKRVSMVQSQCAYVCDKMEYLVDRFAGLAKGNLTPLESLIERIRYLLDKPDIKDLRLSVRSATTTINTMSTLFLWEETKNNARRIQLTEQLRNFLPMSKKASSELAAHQQRHGVKYDSGMPDPNNAILATSKEIRRQVARAIKPHSRAGAAENENPRDSFGGQVSLSGPSSSPPGSRGSAVDSAGHISRRRANRVSLNTSTQSRGSHLGDDGVRASQKGAVVPSPNSRRSQSPHAELLSPSADSVAPSRTSSEVSERVQVSPTAHEEQPPESQSIRSAPPKAYFALDISDPMKPRIHPCSGGCNIEYCSCCYRAHCIRDYCLFSDDSDAAEDKNLDSNIPGGSIIPSEPKRATSNERSSHGDKHSSPEEQVRHYPPTTIEGSEVSDLSDTKFDRVIGRWSRTDLALSSSKSSSPSMEIPRPLDVKSRDPKTVRPAETEPQEASGSGKKVSGVYDKRPRLQTKQDQSRHLGSALEVRQSEAREKGVKKGRRRESESVSYRSHVSDDGNESSEEEGPNPYVPMAPFGGPGGRRRPRRPHLRHK